jgi:Transposase domain (DUF772)
MGTSVTVFRSWRKLLSGVNYYFPSGFLIVAHQIMMGQHDRSEALFYYFRLEDQVPENHLLRLIDKHISFEFVRDQLRGSYSEAGRPSIDPEFLLRMLLIGYLYGVTSERKLEFQGKKCGRQPFVRQESPLMSPLALHREERPRHVRRFCLVGL